MRQGTSMARVSVLIEKANGISTIRPVRDTPLSFLDASYRSDDQSGLTATAHTEEGIWGSSVLGSFGASSSG